LSSPMNEAPAVVLQTLKEDHETDVFQKLGDARVHIRALPLHSPDKFLGALAIVHDA
jgi:hypothetical protein